MNEKKKEKNYDFIFNNTKAKVKNHLNKVKRRNEGAIFENTSLEP